MCIVVYWFLSVGKLCIFVSYLLSVFRWCNLRSFAFIVCAIFMWEYYVSLCLFICFFVCVCLSVHLIDTIYSSVICTSSRNWIFLCIALYSIKHTFVYFQVTPLPPPRPLKYSRNCAADTATTSAVWPTRNGAALCHVIHLPSLPCYDTIITRSTTWLLLFCTHTCIHTHTHVLNDASVQTNTHVHDIHITHTNKRKFLQIQTHTPTNASHVSQDKSCQEWNLSCNSFIRISLQMHRNVKTKTNTHSF